MSATIPETEFRVTITELDAQMQLRGGYEDGNGNYVTTMTDEQFRAEFAALEGHIRLRAQILEGGEHTAVETRAAPADERYSLAFELTQSVAILMSRWISVRAQESSQALSESELPSC